MSKADDPAETIHSVMVNSGNVNVAHKFAEAIRESDGDGTIMDAFSPALLDKLSEQDEKMRNVGPLKDRTTEEREVEELSPEDRELMAVLALCGYRFSRGMFYWRVACPRNMTVDSLQPSLQALIRRAELHRQNGYAWPKKGSI